MSDTADQAVLNILGHYIDMNLKLPDEAKRARIRAMIVAREQSDEQTEENYREQVRRNNIAQAERSRDRKRQQREAERQSLRDVHHVLQAPGHPGAEEAAERLV
jgi:hypothetical protein